jgi:3'-phosphoadenosine 5'-phosphosulfate sulfotransferase (PAPS reductase)/FAD synthetase
LLPQFGPGGQFEGEEYVRYTGIRRDESEARKNAAFESFDEWYDCTLLAPLADWTKQMCFDYIKAHGEPINPLYSMGFSRVGCAPCINSSKDDIVMWLLKRPDMIEKVRGFEKRTGRTFFAPCVPGHYTNDIDTVLNWAMSLKRGGHEDQPAFPMLFERPSCESKYGLCE